VGIAELGEFGLIRRIAGRVTGGVGVIRGIGDDCALTSTTPGFTTLSTVDLLIEGIHFDRSYTTPHLIGRKSLSVNVSDIAACGGIPRHALLGLALPPGIDTPFVDGFIDGFLAVCTEEGVSLVGGDTCASQSGLMVSVTLLGEQSPDRVVSRGGARPGDLIVVSGTLGDAAVGLELLRRGERDMTLFPIARHLDPTPRTRLARALAGESIPSAMIDISDGLLADLGHILDASGVGAQIDVATLPRHDATRRAAARLGLDPLLPFLAGGEEYELLFTLPPTARGKLDSLSRHLSLPLTVIGTVREETGVTLLDGNTPIPTPPRRGYDHFRTAEPDSPRS